MQWSEEEECSPLLCFAAVALLSNSVKVALVRLSRRREGLMRARPAWSLLWGVLRGWPARPAVGHILARQRICLPLAARTRPSQMWYSTHVASAGFLSSVPVRRLWIATGARAYNGFMANRLTVFEQQRVAMARTADLLGLLWRRYMEPEPLLSHLRLRPRVTSSPSCAA